ncbi:hypothetical protein [Uliginosibacterium sp. H1]|uniref:hypothetical protein n=1 Tax=Uliginosibacterium sp. H1 TaxID=3114757 RepID=UPI002E184E72|nr:hypothetical protein [Uliginosibacterium sp. H1]
MPHTFTAWQCGGCGRIESQQACTGACRDSKVQLIHHDEYVALEKHLAQSQHTVGALLDLLSQLAHATPREGQWETCFRQAQARARDTLRRHRSV